MLTSTSEQLNNKTCLIFTSWHQLDIRCYGNFKVQKFCFKKMLVLFNGEDGFFAESTYMYSANILRSVLLKLLRRVLKNTRRYKNTER